MYDAVLEARSLGKLIVEMQAIGVTADPRELSHVRVRDLFRERDSIANAEFLVDIGRAVERPVALRVSDFGNRGRSAAITRIGARRSTNRRYSGAIGLEQTANEEFRTLERMLVHTGPRLTHGRYDGRTTGPALLLAHVRWYGKYL